MGRPKGYRVSAEERERIGAGVKRAWARRRKWVDVSNSILAAANAGDRDLAGDLLNDWLEEQHEQDENTLLAMSSLDVRDRQEIIADMADYADELRADTAYYQRERHAADADIEAFRLSVLRDVRALVSLTAELRKGRELSQYGAASTPYVGQDDVRHVPMTVTHTHDHGAHGHPDSDDGIHSHEHTHDSDASHDHHTGVNLSVAEAARRRVRPQEGNYGRQMNDIGPAERARLKRQQLAEHESRLGRGWPE